MSFSFALVQLNRNRKKVSDFQEYIFIRQIALYCIRVSSHPIPSHTTSFEIVSTLCSFAFTRSSLSLTSRVLSKVTLSRSSVIHIMIAFLALHSLLIIIHSYLAMLLYIASTLISFAFDRSSLCIRSASLRLEYNSSFPIMPTLL